MSSMKIQQMLKIENQLFIEFWKIIAEKRKKLNNTYFMNICHWKSYNS